MRTRDCVLRPLDDLRRVNLTSTLFAPRVVRMDTYDYEDDYSDLDGYDVAYEDFDASYEDYEPNPYDGTYSEC